MAYLFGPMAGKPCSQEHHFHKPKGFQTPGLQLAAPVVVEQQPDLLASQPLHRPKRGNSVTVAKVGGGFVSDRLQHRGGLIEGLVNCRSQVLGAIGFNTH